MASPSISKTSYHARSISLPSRPHPVVDKFDEQLSRLRSSQTASTSSSVSQRLTGLTRLFDCVDELLLIPSNQQANCTNDMLDGSLRLLDICGTTRDALLQTKEYMMNIQSVLRRRCSGELSIEKEVVEYLNARKSVKKAIKSCLRDIKKVETNDESCTIVGMFMDVEAATQEIFKSFLIHIAGSKMQSTKSSWSAVKKFVRQSSKNEEVKSVSEFEELDAILSSLISKKNKTGINMMQVENLRSRMANIESEIQEVDEKLESLFRHLVKTRATLLNIQSN